VERVTLIAGFGKHLPMALAREAARRSRVVCLARLEAPTKAEASKAEVPGAEALEVVSEKQEPRTAAASIVQLGYQAGSALSARSLFLEASTARGPIAEFILAMESAPQIVPVLEADARAAESFLDEGPRAWLQLMREAVRHFRKSGSGRLVFCLPAQDPRAKRDAPPPGLHGLRLAMLTALAEVCLAESSPSLPVYAFTGSPESADDYALAAFRVLDEGSAKSSGKWIKAAKGALAGIFS
jgi:hypothetical protein